MVRLRKLREKHYKKIWDSFNFLGVYSIDAIGPVNKAPVFRATLPPGARACLIDHYFSWPGGTSLKAIIVSNRLRSRKTIDDEIKHELIHLVLADNRHGREFKKMCLELGLNPEYHA